MEIYISYSWKAPIKAIVKHWLCPSLKDNHINYVIDEKDCGYGDDIVKFEKGIGKADNVIIMLSKSYFMSQNCMFELALIIKNKGYNKRLMWVSADDFDRNEAESIKIFDFWKQQEEQTKANLTGDENRDKLFTNKLEQIQLILESFSYAWQLIQNTNTLSFERISENNFKELIAFIKNEAMEEDSLMEKPNTDIPMDVGFAPKGISIVQNGNKSVAQTIIGGTVTINM